MAKKTTDEPIDFQPHADLVPSATGEAQPDPVPVTIVPPKPPAAALAAAQPEPIDPEKVTPPNQINVPPPPPEDPLKPRFPSDAVPIGQEHKTPAAQQRAAEKVFAGEDPSEPDEKPGESGKKSKK